jgi:hypothetical protein
MAFLSFPDGAIAPVSKERQSSARVPGARHPPVKLIYIAGYGRSGSTLLDIALGQHPSIMGAGEVTTLSRHVWENDEYCACGAPVQDCPIWKPIVEQWRDDEPISLMAEYRTEQEKSESIVGGRLFHATRHQNHVRRTVKLLQTMSAISGRPVLVDSSKLPGRASALAKMPGIELYVIHLVRDGRGVAWSLSKGYRRQVDQGLQRDLRPKPLIYTAIRWASVNIATGALCRRLGPDRSLCVRYEDFVADPRETIGKIIALVGEQKPDWLTDPEHRPLEPHHQVAGSRHRMQRSITVQKDEKWKTEMPRWKQRAFTFLTAPLMRRYGYSLCSFSGRSLSGRPFSGEDLI